MDDCGNSHSLVVSWIDYFGWWGTNPYTSCNRTYSDCDKSPSRQKNIIKYSIKLKCTSSYLY